MDTTTKPLDELTPADYNPRVQLTPDDPEYQQLRESIERFGLVEPLVWNKRTGRIVGGHQRLTVLRDLGFDTVPVVEVDLDETQERALNVALNKIDGRWDEHQLLAVVEGLRADEWELSSFGFTDDEYDALLRRIDQEHSTEFISDLYDSNGEDEDVWRTNRGGHEGAGDDVPGFEKAWFSMAFSVTGEERTLVLEALETAKKRAELDTSAKALVHVMNHYLAAPPNDTKDGSA